MKKNLLLRFIFLLNALLPGVCICASEAELPSRSNIIAAAQRVNDHWITNHTDPGNNLWARAAYHVGNIELYKVFPKQAYLDYAVKWANRNNWAISGGASTSNSDNHACGQVYIDLFLLDGAKDPAKIEAIKNAIDNRMVNNTQSSDWWWVDAMFMAMPTITRLGVVYDDTRYFDRLYSLFHNTRDTLLVNPAWWTATWAEQYAPGPIVTCTGCGNQSDGLYNPADGLWWRDWRYQPDVPHMNSKPKTTPAGKNVYWSRGNGWVIAALARTLELLPANDAHRQEYIDVFTRMAQALKDCQREDGFWNMNLADDEYYPAPETSGTAFFAYGLAWGINNGFLDRNTYYPVVAKAWNGLATVAVESDGNVRYAQNVGDEPIDPARLTTSSVDFGVGAVLLAAVEVSKLAFDDGLPPFDESAVGGVLLDRTDWTITTSSIGATDTAVGGDNPQNIIDGDLRSAFLFVKPDNTYGGITVAKGTQPWFAIDMKRAGAMTYLLYRHRDYNNATSYLRASKASFYGKNAEAGEYQPIMEHFAIAADDDEVRVDFPEKVSYRYVKLLFEAWDTSNGFTIQTSEFNLGNTVSSVIRPPVWNNSADLQVSLYPNPVKAGQPFYIRLYDEQPDITLTLYTIWGTKLSEQRYKTQMIEQTIERQGIYLAELTGDAWRHVSKIVVN